MFYFLCLYKTSNFDIIIKKSSFIFLRYDLFDPLFVYCCYSFSSRMVNKTVDFCCEKVHVSQSISEKRKREGSLVPLRSYWMLMFMCLPKFDIYDGKITVNCFKSYPNSFSWFFFKRKFCLMYGFKFTLSEVASFLMEKLLVLKKSCIQACLSCIHITHYIT